MEGGIFRRKCRLLLLKMEVSYEIYWGVGKCGPVGPHDGKAQLCGIKHGKAYGKKILQGKKKTLHCWKSLSPSS